jgi:uncharacterized membrane protein YoaK (UPF0700 family)
VPATLHTPETIFTARHVPSWLLLAAAAGFADGFAFLTSQQAVSYMTGIATRVGVEYRDVGIAAEYGLVFLSFLAGAAASFAVITWRARTGGRDRWAVPLFVVAGITAGVAVAGELRAFAPFGTGRAADPPPVTFLSLLAFAAGLQNGSVSATTGMAVRTTHLTGPTTDMGLLLGAALMTAGAERWAALRGAALRAGIALAFVVGAGLAVPLAGRLGYLALLVPAGFVVAAGVLSFLPDWSPSDFPFHPTRPVVEPGGATIGLPADGKPLPGEKEKAAG